MNYSMQGTTRTIPKLFAMLKSAKVEIKKEHQVLMVDKITSFKKKGKGKERGTSSRMTSKLSLPWRSPKLDPSLKLSASTAKESGHWKRNCPKYLADKKASKTKGICDIHVIDVYLTSTRSSSWVFDTGAVAHICNSKQELRNKRRLAKDEVTICVGSVSKFDVI